MLVGATAMVVVVVQCCYGVVVVVLGSWYFAMQLLRWFWGFDVGMQLSCVVFLYY